MLRWLFAIALAAVLAVPAVARAQIVNIQSALAKIPDRDGQLGTVELKLDWREGNNPVIDTSGTATFGIRRGRSITLLLVRGGYAETHGLLITEKTFEHARERIVIDCRWRWEVFAQHELDKFRRLAVRALAGTGPALAIVKSAEFDLTAGLAYMFDYEQIDTKAGAIDAGRRTIQHRASSYLTGDEKLTATTELVETVYVQPDFADADATRVYGELSLINKLTAHVALTNGFTVAFDQRPPDGVKRYDTELKVGALVTF